VRWLAPEIINGPPVTIFESKPADVFAFAMLAIQIFTGQKPFEGVGDPKVASLISRGERPLFPHNAVEVGLTAQMFEFLWMCWDSEPTKRPDIDNVVKMWECLIKINERREPTPPLVVVEERPIPANPCRVTNFLKKLLCLS